MGVPEEVGRTARAAARSWPETARLCLLMLFAGAAAAIFLTIFMMVLPALTNRS